MEQNDFGNYLLIKCNYTILKINDIKLFALLEYKFF